VFFRVYSGALRVKDGIQNCTQDRKERVTKLLQVHANKTQEIEEVTAGNIAASAQQTSTQAMAASAAAEEVSRSVATVSAGSEEMGASIREISQNAAEAARVMGIGFECSTTPDGGCAGTTCVLRPSTLDASEVQQICDVISVASPPATSCVENRPEPSAPPTLWPVFGNT
jgi:hypothetical protein